MAQTIDAIASLLWPLLVLVVLMVFRRPLARVVRSAEQREWTLEVGGQKLSMRQLSDQQNSMIADLQKQVGVLSQAVAELTANQLSAQGVEMTSQASVYSVLWVDDAPENNALLVEQLQRNGVRVDLAASTRESLALFRQRRYGVVISDMGRLEDGKEISDAGLRLLRLVRELDSSIPFVIYCSARASAIYHDQALADGATAITSSPTVVSEQLSALGLL